VKPIKKLKLIIEDFKVKIKWYGDYEMTPWEDAGDNHGVITPWVSRGPKLYEKTLAKSAGKYRHYDVRASLEKAKTESWGLSEIALNELKESLGHDPSEQEICMHVIKKDFQFFQDFLLERWHYTWYEFSIKKDGKTYEKSSLHGIESTEIPWYESDLIDQARHFIGKELINVNDAACRDIETV